MYFHTQLVVRMKTIYVSDFAIVLHRRRKHQKETEKRRAEKTNSTFTLLHLLLKIEIMKIKSLKLSVPYSSSLFFVGFSFVFFFRFLHLIWWLVKRLPVRSFLLFVDFLIFFFHNIRSVAVFVSSRDFLFSLASNVALSGVCLASGVYCQGIGFAAATALRFRLLCCAWITNKTNFDKQHRKRGREREGQIYSNNSRTQVTSINMVKRRQYV